MGISKREGLKWIFCRNQMIINQLIKFHEKEILSIKTYRLFATTQSSTIILLADHASKTQNHSSDTILLGRSIVCICPSDLPLLQNRQVYQ